MTTDGLIKDYLIELNAMLSGLCIRRACRRLNRILRTEAATVVSAHKTLLRVRGIARKVIAQALTRLLQRHGSAVIVRRRGKAGAWLCRPSANRLLVRI